MIRAVQGIERNVDNEFHHFPVIDESSIGVYVREIAGSCGDGRIRVASCNGIAELINANKNAIKPIHLLS